MIGVQIRRCNSLPSVHPSFLHRCSEKEKTLPRGNQDYRCICLVGWFFCYRFALYSVEFIFLQNLGFSRLQDVNPKECSSE